VAVVGAVALLAGPHGRAPARTSHSATVDTPPRAVQASPIDPQAGDANNKLGDIRAEIMFLYDVSTSTHSGKPDDPFSRAARSFHSALTGLRDDRLLPARYRVGTIGSTGMMQEPLCDFRVEPAAIFAHSDTTLMKARVTSCEKMLTSHAAERATDIRGSLNFAALSLSGSRRLVRGIVVLTDLDEMLPADQSPATPDLAGMCVAVYSMITPANSRNPNELRDRESQWQTQLKLWHARRVHMGSVLGFSGQDLSSFFITCGASDGR
jgi:hypothetical protein